MSVEATRASVKESVLIMSVVVSVVAVVMVISEDRFAQKIEQSARRYARYSTWLARIHRDPTA